MRASIPSKSNFYSPINLAATLGNLHAGRSGSAGAGTAMFALAIAASASTAARNMISSRRPALLNGDLDAAPAIAAPPDDAESEETPEKEPAKAELYDDTDDIPPAIYGE